MAQKEFTVDTRQLEALSAELTALPKDVLGAMRSSLVTGVRDSLTKVASQHYAITLGTMGGTFRVFSRRMETPSSAGIQFDVSGRRLTLSHFRFFPKERWTRRPIIEIIHGYAKRATPQTGEDGKAKVPFVMRFGKTGQFNVFVRLGRASESNPKYEALKSYRTVSVPQMIGYPPVAEEVQDNLLRVFDRNLTRRIQRRTGLMQQHITRA